jgi:phenylacetate-coenzyme A ligase PaaK-like adenylate-forming protein
MIDTWIGEKIGLPPNAPLTREAIEGYQLAALRRTLYYVKENSRWYSRTLKDIDTVRDVCSVTDLAKLPFTDTSELTSFGTDMVCVSASQVSRIVTLPTSGTTGEPKRVYFTEADQELMIDYNANGLKVMTSPGDLWLALMPAERPGSVGNLIVAGLARMGCEAIAYGILPYEGGDDDRALALMAERGVNCMLATTSAASRLARRYASETSAAGSLLQQIPQSMNAVLLSAEYVSDENVRLIEETWDCKVFEHYGMTEMGLGGAMACETRAGYHPREADLIFEIIDPKSGDVLPDGEYGEIVFTTLTREAMPFIRYRTGDFSRFIPGPCPCGSATKRLDRVADRKSTKGY